MLIRSDLRCNLNIKGKDEFYLDTRIIPQKDVREDNKDIHGYKVDRWFYPLSLEKMEETVPNVYLLKQEIEIEYIPSKLFGKYEPPVYDIDDFGDYDEGWEDFHDATEGEDNFYNRCVYKNTYIVAYIKSDTLVHEKNLIKYIESTMLKANKDFLDSVK